MDLWFWICCLVCGWIGLLVVYVMVVCAGLSYLHDFFGFGFSVDVSWLGVLIVLSLCGF